MISSEDIVEGLRVDSILHNNGVCTGETRLEAGELRAHVIWPNDVHRWPTVRILEHAKNPIN